MKSSQPYRAIISLLGYVAIACLLAIVLVKQHAPGLELGRLAPIQDRINMLSATSSHASSSSFSAFLDRPLVINFWAPWCPPCLKELPILGLLASQYRGQVNFIGAAVDGTRDELINLKRRFVLDYPIAWVSPELAKNWQAETLPTTYIIDTKGLVVWVKIGQLSQEELNSALQDVLKK